MRVFRPLVAVVLAALTLLLAPSLAGAADDIQCVAGSTTPCVDAVSLPSTVSVATTGSESSVAWRATIRNRGASTLTHVTVANTPPAGVVDAVITSDRGSCGGSSCDLGNIVSGGHAVVTVTASTPSVAGTLANRFVTNFSAGPNSGNDPKTTATSTPTTSVLDQAGFASTWVRANKSAEIQTDPRVGGAASGTAPMTAGASVAARTTGVSALLNRRSAAFTCPTGEICRTDSTWIEAQVRDDFNLIAAFPSALTAPLRFSLRWDASILAPKQTTKNIAVFYVAELGDTPQVFRTRCDAGASVRPCLTGITKLRDGDISAVLVKDSNGYMR